MSMTSNELARIRTSMVIAQPRFSPNESGTRHDSRWRLCFPANGVVVKLTFGKVCYKVHATIHDEWTTSPHYWYSGRTWSRATPEVA